MSLVAMTSRIGGFGAMLGAALGIATMTTAARPAEVRAWASFGVPAWTYAPPPAPVYRPRPYVYGYPYSYPSFGFYVGDGDYGWHRHHWQRRHWQQRHWSDWDDD